MNGEGELYYEDGRIFKGMYLNDLKQGYGKCFFPDGKIMEGYWEKGKQEREGRLINSKTGSVRVGLWQNG